MVKSYGRIFYRWLIALGINPLHTFSFITEFIHYFKTYFSLKKQARKELGDKFPIFLNYPCLHDRKDNSGVAKGHYFYQDMVVAQSIYKANPKRHLDVASRVDGFVAHVATFRPIDVLDIRPLSTAIDNINFIQEDLTNISSSEKIETSDSVSCLHALEHFGLGRYNDPISATGYEEGFKNISQLVQVGGTLYLSVPTGRERIEFNAHRVFSTDTILNLTKREFELKEFSYVDDNGDLHQGQELTEDKKAELNNMHYGCGIYTLTKKESV